MTVDKAIQLGWRKFLLTEQGSKGLLWLREQTPVVLKGDAHEMIFDSGRAQGYRDTLDKLSLLLGGEPEINKEFESGLDLYPTR